jgi:hypothetical protein
MLNFTQSRYVRELLSNSVKLLKGSPSFAAFACFNAILRIPLTFCAAFLRLSRIFQEVSVRFLAKIIEYFTEIPDPDEPNSSILEQFGPQMYSVVKHAISAHDESASPAARRLFIAGCEVLHTIVESRLSADLIVLKRLLRPIVPIDVPIFGFETGYPTQQLSGERVSADTRSMLLPMFGKLWTAGKILVGNGEQSTLLETVARDLITDEAGLTGLAIHSAAAALDGVRLLRCTSLSLAGRRCIGEQEAAPCGFIYRNQEDMDESVKALLITRWSSFASCALRPLLAAVSSGSSEQKVVDDCSSWLRVIVPLLIAGIEDACDAVLTEDTSAQSTMGLAEVVDPPMEVLVDCIRGVTQLTATKQDHYVCSTCTQEDTERVIELLDKSILRPVLEGSSSPPTERENPGRMPDAIIITETCSLLRGIASTESTLFRKDSNLLVALLTPLDSLQKGNLSLDNKMIEEIVTTCLIAVGILIAQGQATDALVKAMLQFVLSTILSSTDDKKEWPSSIVDGAKSLLRACLSSKSVDGRRRLEVAKEVASSENWQVWTCIAPVDDGNVVVGSLDTVQQKLSDLNQTTSQLAVLAAVRTVLQSTSIPGKLAGVLFHGIGSEVLVILYQYGSLQVPEAARQHCTAACADAMKVILLAYQQLSSDTEELTGFLELFFGALLAVLRCNGLPNHPTVGGDPALGRMCAQAILHVARATPVPFKTSLTAMAEHDRALMEFAVRAEMTGYATTDSQQQQTKKKISLKGFKK